MSKKVKAGVIGCGAIAQAMHLPGYAESRNASLEAACDPAGSDVSDDLLAAPRP